MNYDKWLYHTFSTGDVAGKDYLLFQKEMKKDLINICKQHGLSLYEFYRNHYAFSAILKDENKDQFIYISVPDVRSGTEWYDHVLIRTMKNDHDWVGEVNHYTSWINIGNTARDLVDKKMRRMIMEKKNILQI